MKKPYSKIEKIINLHDNGHLNESQTICLIKDEINSKKQNYTKNTEIEKTDSFNYDFTQMSSKIWIEKIILPKIKNHKNINHVNSMIEKLKDPSFCNNELKIRSKNLPFLKSLKDFPEYPTTLTQNGHPYSRYYKNPYTIKEEKYWILSQWYNDNKPIVEKWFKKQF